MRHLKAAFTALPYCIATYVALIGLAWLLLFPFQPVKANPPVYSVANPKSEAILAALSAGGRVWEVAHTGSMRPFLDGGEFVVTASAFESIKLGQILTYKADYHDIPIVHRAVQKDEYGWLMAGDASPRSESWARVTTTEYLGTVIAVYRPIAH